MTRRENTGSAFFLGAAVGAIAALLFAPFSGKKMRKKTNEKGREAFDKMKVKYHEFEERTLIPKSQEVKDQSTEAIEEKTAELKEAAVELKDRLQEETEKVIEKVKEAAKSAKEGK